MSSVKFQDKKFIYKTFIAFLHTTNKLSERKQKSILFKNASKRIKNLNKFNQGRKRTIH